MAFDTSSINGLRIGSIMDEWKAWDVCKRRQKTCSDFNSSSSSSTACVVPATVHNPGALMAASDSCGRNSRIERNFCSGSEMTSIEPDGRLCISRPRAATSRSVSSSEKTPARQAATYSPMLWPIIACGLTPHSIHCLASAYSVTKSAG